MSLFQKSVEKKFLNELDIHRCKSIQDEIDESILLRTKVYAFLHAPSPKTKSRFSLVSNSKFSIEFIDEYEQRRQELTESIDSLMSSLLSQGFQSKKLDQKKILGIVYKYLNPARSKQIEQPTIFTPTDDITDAKIQYHENALASPRSQLAFGDLILDQNDFN